MLFIKNKKTLNLNCRKVKPNKYAFTDSLEKLVIGKNVKEISSTSFLGCRNLSEVVFGEGLEIIGERAFFNCGLLKKVILPDSLRILGEGAFADCRAIEEIHLPSTIKYLPKGAFKNCTSLKKVVLPQGLIEIGEECFSGCTELEEIVFYENLTKIEDKAFKRCESLMAVILPQSLEHLGSNTFSACHNLQYVKLNSKLSFLGRQPFSKPVCSKLQVVGKAYCSSFLTEDDAGQCPTIAIPEDVNELLLGFNGMLEYTDISKNKTCFNHILSSEQSAFKLFIGEKYYSYMDENDYIIKDGELDFIKYDNEFSKASDFEKPFISAFRLVYRQALTEENALKYKRALAGKEKQVAVFSAERNEAEILSYVIKNCEFDSAFYTELYNIAIQNGNKNLLNIISLHSKNTGISETENLLRSFL